MDKSPSKTEGADDTASFKDQMAARYKERQSMGFHLEHTHSPSGVTRRESGSGSTEDTGSNPHKSINVPVKSVSLDQSGAGEQEGQGHTFPASRRSMKDLITHFERRSHTALDPPVGETDGTPRGAGGGGSGSETPPMGGGGESGNLARVAWRGSNRALHMDLDVTAVTSSSSSLSLSGDSLELESDRARPGGAGRHRGRRPGRSGKPSRRLRSASSTNLERGSLGLSPKPSDVTGQQKTGEGQAVCGESVVLNKESANAKVVPDVKASRMPEGISAPEKTSPIGMQKQLIETAGQQENTIGSNKTAGLKGSGTAWTVFESPVTGTAQHEQPKESDNTDIPLNQESEQQIPQPLRVNLKEFAARTKRSFNPDQVKYVVHRKDWKKWMQAHPGAGQKQKSAVTLPDGLITRQSVQQQKQQAKRLGTDTLDLCFPRKPSPAKASEPESVKVDKTSAAPTSRGGNKKVVTSASNTQQRLDRRNSQKVTSSQTTTSESLFSKPGGVPIRQGGAIDRYLQFLSRTSKVGQEGFTTVSSGRHIQEKQTAPRPMSEKSEELGLHEDQVKAVPPPYPALSLSATPSPRRKKELSQQALQALIKHANEKDQRPRLALAHLIKEGAAQRNMLLQNTELFDMPTSPTGSLMSNTNTVSTADLDNQTEKALSRLQEVMDAKRFKSNANDLLNDFAVATSSSGATAVSRQFDAVFKQRENEHHPSQISHQASTPTKFLTDALAGKATTQNTGASQLSGRHRAARIGAGRSLTPSAERPTQFQGSSLSPSSRMSQGSNPGPQFRSRSSPATTRRSKQSPSPTEARDTGSRDSGRLQGQRTPQQQQQTPTPTHARPQRSTQLDSAALDRRNSTGQIKPQFDECEKVRGSTPALSGRQPQKGASPASDVKQEKIKLTAARINIDDMQSFATYTSDDLLSNMKLTGALSSQLNMTEATESLDSSLHTNKDAPITWRPQINNPTSTPSESSYLMASLRGFNAMGDARFSSTNAQGKRQPALQTTQMTSIPATTWPSHQSTGRKPSLQDSLQHYSRILRQEVPMPRLGASGESETRNSVHRAPMAAVIRSMSTYVGPLKTNKTSPFSTTSVATKIKCSIQKHHHGQQQQQLQPLQQQQQQQQEQQQHYLQSKKRRNADLALGEDTPMTPKSVQLTQPTLKQETAVSRKPLQLSLARQPSGLARRTSPDDKRFSETARSGQQTHQGRPQQRAVTARTPDAFSSATSLLLYGKERGKKGGSSQTVGEEHRPRRLRDATSADQAVSSTAPQSRRKTFASASRVDQSRRKRATISPSADRHAGSATQHVKPATPGITTTPERKSMTTKSPASPKSNRDSDGSPPRIPSPETLMARAKKVQRPDSLEARGDTPGMRAAEVESNPDKLMPCHFGSHRMEGEENSQSGMPQEEVSKVSNVSPDASAKKRKRRLTEKTKKTKKRKKKQREDDMEDERDIVLSSSEKSGKHRTKEKRSKVSIESFDGKGDEGFTQLRRSGTLNEISPTHKGIMKHRRESTITELDFSNKKDSPESIRTEGVTSVTIRKVSPVRSPPVRIKLPTYRPVRPLSNSPTPGLPSYSLIPLKVDGRDFGPASQRALLLAKYRRWREGMADPDRPSKLPLSPSFRWTLDSAVVEEWALHGWEPDGGIYVDEHGAWWSSVDQSKASESLPDSLLAGSNPMSMDGLLDMGMRLPKLRVGPLRLLHATYLAMGVACVMTGRFFARLYQCGGDDFDFFCNEDSIECLMQIVQLSQ